ncbi:MAG: RNase adapter RapZ, partial [Clostridia bacterium]|nr:RNase adapter RapZ [Clostridia bacterium]
AGKTQVLHRLEDIGFFCVDNLPISLLESFVKMCNEEDEIENAAVVIDSRARESFDKVYDMVEGFKDKGYKFELLFLDASDVSLTRRFKANHRIHPIKGCSLVDGIAIERKMLAHLKELANHVIDTTNINTKKLDEIIDKAYGDGGLDDEQILVFVNSFGFKRGIPLDADMVFDVRFLPNPYWEEDLKSLTGKSEEIQKYIKKFSQTQDFLDKLYELVAFLVPLNSKSGKDQFKIAIGCTGGQHRSVAVAEILGQKLIEEGYRVILSHRDMEKDGTA